MLAVPGKSFELKRSSNLWEVKLYYREHIVMSYNSNPVGKIAKKTV